jgi:hypothetical protein
MMQVQELPRFVERTSYEDLLSQNLPSFREALIVGK